MHTEVILGDAQIEERAGGALDINAALVAGLFRTRETMSKRNIGGRRR